MTNQEKLEALIQKAIDGGWKQDLHWQHGNIKNPDKVFMTWVSNLELSGNHAYYDYGQYFCILELIFNHDFAKAIWSDALVAIRNIEADDYIKLTTQEDHTTEDVMPAFKYHLQQMVISDDPIDYAYKAVFGEGEKE